MKAVETDFSKDLSNLLKYHNKTITADKGGIYAIDCDYSIVSGNQPVVYLTESETASEDSRPKLIFVQSTIT